MADDIREVRESEYREGPENVRRTEVTHNSTDTSVSRVQQFVYTLTGILSGILAIRFVLSLLGANRLNGFANLIYTITSPFVAPFRGLFGIDTQVGISRIEIETLVAIAVYALIAWAIVRLLNAGKRHPA